MAEGILGFCKVEVNPLGPLQLLPLVAVDVKLIACPTHTGLLAVGTGVAGTGFTVTAMVAVAEVQPLATA